MLTKKNALGYAVLALIHHRLTPSQISGLDIEPYLNGRENGFAVTRGIKVVFAQGRRSENIVVYHGDPQDFDDNTPNDVIYDHRRLFDDVNNAVEFIIKGLLFPGT